MGDGKIRGRIEIAFLLGLAILAFAWFAKTVASSSFASGWESPQVRASDPVLDQAWANSWIGVAGLLIAFLAQGLLWSTISRSYHGLRGDGGLGGRWVRSLNTLRAYVADEDPEG